MDLTKRLMIARNADVTNRFLYCRLCDIQQACKELIEEYGPNATLDIGGDADDLTVFVQYHTEETEAEYTNRQNLYKAQKEREYTKYLELKAKFE